MLATFLPTVASMEDEFCEMVEAVGGRTTIQTYCVPAAIAALKAGDGAEHDRLIAEAAPRFADCDAILLAHFSTARAASAVACARSTGSDKSGQRDRQAEGDYCDALGHA
jgi:hypothetical protein